MKKQREQNIAIPDSKMLARRVRRIRQELGMTQTQVASLLGVTPGLICNIESGRSAVSLKLLILYAGLMNTTVDFIIGTLDPVYCDRSRENEVLALFAKLSARDQKRLIGALRAWLT